MTQTALPDPLCIHLGCNETKILNWVNVDARPTVATDLVHDCSNLSPFPAASAAAIFSHAFFEHLTMRGRAELLADVWRVLRPDGFVYFCGLPDFEVVARS